MARPGVPAGDILDVRSDTYLTVLTKSKSLPAVRLTNACAIRSATRPDAGGTTSPSSGAGPGSTPIAANQDGVSRPGVDGQSNCPIQVAHRLAARSRLVR